MLACVVDAEARLIPVVHVGNNGEISDSLKTETGETDVTGGIALKLKSAVSIVCASGGRLQPLLCSIAGNAFLDACMHGQWQRDTVGTVVVLQH